MSFIDFGALKERVSIEQVIAMLGIDNLKRQGAQLRGPCPIHGGNNPREFVVTPEKGLFFCFAGCGGGDQIALVSKMKTLSAKDAAGFIAEHLGSSTVTGPVTAQVPRQSTVPQNEKGQLKPLDYLQPEHELVQALGVSAETCRTFGAGYAAKGIMRGKFAIPVYDRLGALIAYCGRAVKNESPTLSFPNGFDPHSIIFGAHRINGGELYLVRDPLQVLTAFEAGVENVVAFLTDGITAQQFEQLSSLMDEKRCDLAQLY